MSTTTAVSARERSVAIAVNRLLYHFSRNWWIIFSLLWGLYVGLPFLAPVLMKLGFTGAATVIYALYSTQCHQLPQRSFFLFGSKGMYSLSEVQAAWQATNNPLILRQFIGATGMGWKVAWSDRMVSMYTSIFIGGLLYWPVRKWLRPLPLWAFALFLLPMAIDGGTHMISDVAGIGNGFRDSNIWLAALTGNRLPAIFYTGDALGSFNSWMRLLTGVWFGIGVVWLAYPHLNDAFAEVAAEVENKFRNKGLSL